jgi:hypothetical protein
VVLAAETPFQLYWGVKRSQHQVLSSRSVR